MRKGVLGVWVAVAGVWLIAPRPVADDCICSSRCPVTIESKEFNVTVGARAGVAVPLGPGAGALSISGSVSLSYALATTLTIEHLCSYHPAGDSSLSVAACCPTSLSAVAYTYAEERVTGLWDPSVPGSELAPKDVVTRTILALLPERPVEKDGPHPAQQTCWTTQRYSAEALSGHLSLSFAASLGYRQVSATARAALARRKMTVECATVCQACGQPECASPPTIVSCPGTEAESPIILPEGESVEFRVEVLDPDGAGDIVGLWVESVRGGADVTASLLGSESGETTGLQTRKGKIVLTWRPGTEAGSAMVFARDGCGREHFRTFHYVVATPPAIKLVSGPTSVESPCCGGEGIAWTLEIHDPTYTPQEQGRPGYCVSVEVTGGGVAGLLERGGACQWQVLRPRAIPTWMETVNYCSDGSLEPCSVRVTVTDLLRLTHAVWEAARPSQANSPPEFDPTSLEPPVWTPVSYRTQMLVMDPAWYEIGCLRVTDPDGDDVAIQVGKPARYGVASVLARGAGGEYDVTVTYQASPVTLLAWHRSRYCQADSFTVVADDHRGGRAEVPVTVRSAVLNAAPTCGADAASTKSRVPVDVFVLANDTDLDRDDLVIAAVGTPNHGVVAFVAGNVTYTPAAGYVGEDSFTYAVSDGYGGTGTGRVTVTVTDAEPPTFTWHPPFSEPIANDVGTCGAVVTWTPPEIGADVTDNVGVSSLTSSHTPGSAFPVGSTTVTYTATDAAGNAASFSFVVEIEDREAPVLRDVPPDIVTAAAPGEAAEAMPGAADPNAIYYAAVGCDAFEGETISFDYEIEDDTARELGRPCTCASPTTSSCRGHLNPEVSTTTLQAVGSGSLVRSTPRIAAQPAA